MTYWCDVDPPMSFIPEGWTLEQKRRFRYDTIDYLPRAAQFDRYAGKRVLCIGDGSGIDAVEFARGGADVTVLDMSEKAIELTRKHAAEAAVSLVARAGDACELPFEASSFGAAYSFGVFHHIPHVEKAVSEVARVLRPGGEFFGMVYHKDSVYYALSILARAQRENISAGEAMRRWSERNPGCPYSRAYTREEVHALLSSRFLVDTEAYYDVVDLPNRRKVRYSIDDMTGSAYGWHLFFRALKK